MTQRVTLGILVIALLFGAILLDITVSLRLIGVEGPIAALLRRGSIIPVIVMAMSILGAVELNRMMRMKEARPHARFAYAMIAILVCAPWFSTAGLLGQQAAQVEGLYWQLAGLAAALLGTGLLTVARRNPQGALRDAGATLLVIMYLGFATSFALQLRCSPGATGPAGAWLLLMTILVTKASDIGGYFVGSALGRHRLIPSVSPGKTIEGTVGALLGGAVAGALFASGSGILNWFHGDSPLMGSRNNLSGPVLQLLSEAARSMNLAPRSEGFLSMQRGFVLGIFLAIVGQFGDLFESCFKRDAGTKDSGNVLPRFGGILDLIDSPVLALPVAWFFLTAVWSIL